MRWLLGAAAVAVEVYFKGNASLARGPSDCRVIHLGFSEDARLPDGTTLDLNPFDAIFTDARDLAAYQEVRRRLLGQNEKKNEKTASGGAAGSTRNICGQ